MTRISDETMQEMFGESDEIEAMIARDEALESADEDEVVPVAEEITTEMLPSLFPMLYRQTKNNGVLTCWNKSQPLTPDKRNLENDIAETVSLHVVHSCAKEKGEMFTLSVILNEHCSIVMSHAASNFICETYKTLSLITAGWKLSAK
jgi:hypothetical protein